MYVYVLHRDGRPLMPTQRFGKVRRMLRDGLAVVVRRDPFTIRLTYETTDYVQDVDLGVDAGSKEAGVSACTKEKELYAAQAELRNDITKNLSERVNTAAQGETARRDTASPDSATECVPSTGDGSRPPWKPGYRSTSA